MSARPCLAFACAHLTDERLYASQIAVLGDAFDCRVFVFRDEDWCAPWRRKSSSARRLDSP